MATFQGCLFSSLGSLEESSLWPLQCAQCGHGGPQSRLLFLHPSVCLWSSCHKVAPVPPNITCVLQAEGGRYKGKGQKGRMTCLQALLNQLSLPHIASWSQQVGDSQWACCGGWVSQAAFSSSVHGGSPGKDTGMGCYTLLQGIFPTQGSNPVLLYCKQILYWRSPRILE